MGDGRGICVARVPKVISAGACGEMTASLEYQGKPINPAEM